MPCEVRVPSDGEHFALKVLEKYGGAVEDRAEQKRLIQGYYVFIDRALQSENPPVSWHSIDMESLSRELVCCARLGLDMRQDKQLRPVIAKSDAGKKTRVTIELGCNGVRHLALRYAEDPPKDVTIELVYETDTFTPIKKGGDNEIENYKLEITKPFDRGKIVGGFGYIEYGDSAKNQLVILTRQDIEKRQAIGLDGPQDDDWFAEQCLDIIKREVYSERHIPRDPKKIDDAYWYLKLKPAATAF